MVARGWIWPFPDRPPNSTYLDSVAALVRPSSPQSSQQPPVVPAKAGTQVWGRPGFRRECTGEDMYIVVRRWIWPFPDRPPDSTCLDSVAALGRPSIPLSSQRKLGPRNCLDCQVIGWPPNPPPDDYVHILTGVSSTEPRSPGPSGSQLSLGRREGV